MTRSIIYDLGSGKIISVFSTSKPSEVLANIPLGAGALTSSENIADRYVDVSDPQNLVVLDRPVIPELAAGTAPLSLDLALVPEGSSITVTNEAQEVVVSSDPSLGFTLSDPGAYQILVDPPFPHLQLSQTLDVI